MSTWPNWVDLIIVSVFLLSSYNGFGRGILAELLNLAGAVTCTVLTVNYSPIAILWMQAWVPGSPQVVAAVVFWVVFLSLLLAVRIFTRRVSDLIKWERLHWMIQGVGMVLGGIRGLWWAGIIVIGLSSAGVEYLRVSVEENSVLGPQLVTTARTVLEDVVQVFPGAAPRGTALFPPLH